MWQTRYASAIPKNFGVGVDFLPFSEGNFLSGHPKSMLYQIVIACFAKILLDKLLTEN